MMINLKKIGSFAFIASLLGATSTIAYELKEGDETKKAPTVRKQEESSEGLSEEKVEEIEAPESTISIEKKDEESAAVNALKKQRDDEENALKAAKMRLRALASNKTLVPTAEELPNLQNVFRQLPYEEQVGLVTSVALEGNKIANIGGFRIGPSDERLVNRLKKRLKLT